MRLLQMVANVRRLYIGRIFKARLARFGPGERILSAIVTGHSKNMNEQSVMNIVNELFDRDDILYIKKYEHLEKQVVELLSITGCGNVLDAIKYIKLMQNK